MAFSFPEMSQSAILDPSTLLMGPQAIQPRECQVIMTLICQYTICMIEVIQHLIRPCFALRIHSIQGIYQIKSAIIEGEV